MAKTSAVIVAAGNSVRFGGAVPKQFVAVAGRPLLAWTIERFEKAESIDEIVLVVAEDQLLFAGEKVVSRFGFSKVTRVIPGGETRQKSVLKGLESLSLTTGLVAIHDGARPLVAPEDINDVVKAAGLEKAAILAVRVSDTVKRVKERFVMATQDRADLWLAQTPQVFEHDLILESHRRAAAKRVDVTDDAALVEVAGFKVCVVEARSPNFKVTTREDLMLVETLLNGEIGE
ncbi:MAG: 2-C-methyl-D-erythritol 4-phosphate cytidylyltransferase [Candidatus Zixiibacteriota bacterium]